MLGRDWGCSSTVEFLLHVQVLKKIPIVYDGIRTITVHFAAWKLQFLWTWRIFDLTGSNSLNSCRKYPSCLSSPHSSKSFLKTKIKKSNLTYNSSVTVTVVVGYLSSRVSIILDVPRFSLTTSGSKVWAGYSCSSWIFTPTVVARKIVINQF